MIGPYKRTAPEGTGTDATSKTNQPPNKVLQSKYAGKVRPAPREPNITHYGCSSCRWSA